MRSAQLMLAELRYLPITRMPSLSSSTSVTFFMERSSRATGAAFFLRRALWSMVRAGMETSRRSAKKSSILAYSRLRLYLRARAAAADASFGFEILSMTRTRHETAVPACWNVTRGSCTSPEITAAFSEKNHLSNFASADPRGMRATTRPPSSRCENAFAR